MQQQTVQTDTVFKKKHFYFVQFNSSNSVPVLNLLHWCTNTKKTLKDKPDAKEVDVVYKVEFTAALMNLYLIHNRLVKTDHIFKETKCGDFELHANNTF